MYPYAPTARNQAFTRNRFLSDFWFQLGKNGQHLADMGGRLAVACSFVRYPLVTLAHEYLVDVPFSATPDETEYQIQLVFGINGDIRNVYSIAWGAQTMNADGSHASTAGPQMATTLLVDPIDYTLVGNDGYRVFYSNYPRDFALTEPFQPRLVTTDWLKHVVDPALEPADRILRLSLTKVASGVPTDRDVWLMGICAWGSAGGNL